MFAAAPTPKAKTPDNSNLSTCDKCGEPLLEKKSKFGKTYLRCSKSFCDGGFVCNETLVAAGYFGSDRSGTLATSGMTTTPVHSSGFGRIVPTAPQKLMSTVPRTCLGSAVAETTPLPNTAPTYADETYRYLLSAATMLNNRQQLLNAELTKQLEKAVTLVMILEGKGKLDETVSANPDKTTKVSRTQSVNLQTVVDAAMAVIDENTRRKDSDEDEDAHDTQMEAMVMGPPLAKRPRT